MRQRGRRELDFLRWQLDELRNANLRSGEDIELAAERSAVRHAARLAELGHETLSALHEDGVARALAAMHSASELDARLEAQALRLAAVEEEVADVAVELRRYTDTLDSDPGRLEAIEERLSVLEGIKRKHGGSLDAAIAELEKLERHAGATELIDSDNVASGKERDPVRSELLATNV